MPPASPPLVRTEVRTATPSAMVGVYVMLVGLPALVVAGVLALGVRLPAAMMVVMALVTTALTTPMLDAFWERGRGKPATAH